MTEILIPLSPGSKRPIAAATKWQAADPPVDGWAAVAPEDANWALRMDGLVVVDTDTPEATAWWLEHGQLTNVMVGTPSGGTHFYYRLPEGMEPLPAGAAKHEDGTLAHLDIKTGPGHYVLVPGSKNAEGRPYNWLSPQRPQDAPLLAPEAEQVLRSLKAPRTATEGPDGAAGTGVDLVPSGARHDTFVALTGLMRRLGWSDVLVGKVLAGINKGLTEDGPIPLDELLGIITTTEAWLEPAFEMVADGPAGELPDGTPMLLRATTMEKPPPRPWLWRPWLPEGRLVMLVGPEGIGKGMFAAYLATRAASGHLGEAGRVPTLWFSIEDDPEEDILARLLAAGYDQQRDDEVFFMHPDIEVYFPHHIESVEKFIVENGIRLMIVDPGRAYIRPPEGVKMSYNDEAAMRPALQALNRMAKRTGATVLFIHHTNKNPDADARGATGGTGAFSQAVRHKIDVRKVEDDDEPEWAMAVTKTNYGVAGDLTSYRLVAVPEHETARFELGERIEGFTNIMAWHKERTESRKSAGIDPRTSVELALDAIRAGGGPVPKAAVIAGSLNFSRRVVERAYQELVSEGYLEHQNGRPMTWGETD